MAQKRMTKAESKKETRAIWVIIAIVALTVALMTYAWYTTGTFN